MRLTLQILRKDFERVWWMILPALGLVWYWAYLQVARIPSDGITMQSQNYGLNLALPLAWCLLIARIILYDPLTGDRQFWVALPCGWRPLMAAKTIMIAASVQIPYFIATAVILFARGFNPCAHVPHLLWKQLLLLSLILPALAAATLVRSMSQYLVLSIFVASGVVLLSNRLRMSLAEDTSWDIRWSLSLIVLGIGSVAVIILQFVRRHGLPSRSLGVMTALAAAAIYMYLPRDTSAAIYVALSPLGTYRQPYLRLAPSEPVSVPRFVLSQRTVIAIPTVIDGLQPGADARYDQISLELRNAHGESYRVEWLPTSQNTGENRPVAQTGAVNLTAQVIRFYDPSVWERFRSGPVTLRGRILARFYRPLESLRLEPGQQHNISNTVRCSREPIHFPGVVDSTMTWLDCESPEVVIGDVVVRSLIGGRANYSFIHGVHSLTTVFPQDPWLSPVPFGMQGLSFGLTSITIVTPRTLSHAALIDYTFPGLDLNQYLVGGSARPEGSN